MYRLFLINTNYRQLIQFTQCPAVSEAVAGGKFSLYNGNIEGEYITLDTNKKIEMKWRFKDWDVYSHVEITFEEGSEDDVRI